MGVLEEAEWELQGIPWKEIVESDLSCRHSVQPLVVSTLVEVGEENGYLAIPEIHPTEDFSDRKRIDIGWFDSWGNLRYGFEVDFSVKVNSIRKLHRLPNSAERVIVSSGHRGPKHVEDKVEKYLPPSFKHIDCRVYDFVNEAAHRKRVDDSSIEDSDWAEPKY